MADLENPVFQNAELARELLESIRWRTGVFCPHCAEAKAITKLEGKSHRPGLYQCRSCREQFTVTVGTVFERSKIPLNKWLLATYLLSASKKGMSSHQLHRTLGVTYKTAWFMTHRIREAMKEGGFGLLGSGGGTVEVDETFWGNDQTIKPKGEKKGRGYHHKMKVLSLVERDGKKRSFHVPAVNAVTLGPILKAQIDASASLMTDEAAVYTKVGRSFANHGVVVHSAGEYARVTAGTLTSTNTVESSFALLKRGLYGTFHHVGEQHLQRYVVEFDFRWNHRKTTDMERAVEVLRGIEGKRLTYRRIEEASL